MFLTHAYTSLPNPWGISDVKRRELRSFGCDRDLVHCRNHAKITACCRYVPIQNKGIVPTHRDDSVPRATEQKILTDHSFCDIARSYAHLIASLCVLNKHASLIRSTRSKPDVSFIMGFEAMTIRIRTEINVSCFAVDDETVGGSWNRQELAYVSGCPVLNDNAIRRRSCDSADSV